MRRWNSILLLSIGVVFLSVFIQSVYAAGTFFFPLGTTDFAMAIDYEGKGTITHMNSPQSSPSPIDRDRTSLQDINVMRATDLRVELSGSRFTFTLKIGQSGTTVISYRELVPHDPSFSAFERVSERTNCTVFTCDGVFALTPSRAMELQDVIDTYGADNLLLALDMDRMLGGAVGSLSLHVFSALQPIDIDVKPDDFPNSINPRSRGVIPVAVLTTSDFDATTVDWPTMRFGVTGLEAAPVHAAFDDVDGDGDVDLILHFRTQATAIDCETSTAFLRGSTLIGQLIGGRDAVVTVGCK